MPKYQFANYTFRLLKMAKGVYLFCIIIAIYCSYILKYHCDSKEIVINLVCNCSPVSFEREQ